MSSKFAACVYFDKSFVDIQNLVEPVNKKYFKKYDIEYIVKEGAQKEHNQVPYYHKFGLLQQTLDKRRDLDYVFMMDSDIAILNHNVDIRIFTKMTDRPIMLCTTTDGTNDMYWNINSGAIIVKNTEEARSFINAYMDAAESDGYEINDQPLLQNILAKYNTGLVAVYPKYSFNHALQGSFLYHVCDDSTTNQNFDNAISKKIESLKTAIKNANII